MCKLLSSIFINLIILSWSVRNISLTKARANNFKYILLWNHGRPFQPIYNIPTGSGAFLNCPVRRCYTTYNRNYFGGTLKHFDAILFDGYQINDELMDLPVKRFPHQQYIFSSLESSENSLVCSAIFDNYFNWTVTYRLDSESPFPYFQIRTLEGEVVGPRRDMKWKQYYHYPFRKRFSRKNKTAAWFVSNCYPRSGRRNFVERLEKALAKYNLDIHVFGRCGSHWCPSDRQSICHKMLEEDYYFYLSLENSYAEDYVTEKVLHALKNFVVPIVYGGADYSRFLPPGSYLDGRKMGPEKIAKKMHRMIKYPYLYQQYFQWTSYYRYEDSLHDNVCRFCETVHKKSISLKSSHHANFRHWWNPNYKNSCVENYKTYK